MLIGHAHNTRQFLVAIRFQAFQQAYLFSNTRGTSMTTGPLVIFDLDGTLAHTGPDLLATLNRTIEPHGLPPLSLDTLNYTLGQGAKAMIATAFATAAIPLSTTLHDQLFARFLEDYEQNICVETHLFEGVMEAMVELEKKGCTFAVCTNKTERMARLLFGETGSVKPVQGIDRR